MDTEIESNHAILRNKCKIKGDGHINSVMKPEDKKRTKKTKKTARIVRNSTKVDNIKQEQKKISSKRIEEVRDIDDNIIAELDSIWHH